MIDGAPLHSQTPYLSIERSIIDHRPSIIGYLPSIIDHRQSIFDSAHIYGGSPGTARQSAVRLRTVRVRLPQAPAQQAANLHVTTEFALALMAGFQLDGDVA